MFLCRSTMLLLILLSGCVDSSNGDGSVSFSDDSAQDVSEQVTTHPTQSDAIAENPQEDIREGKAFSTAEKFLCEEDGDCTHLTSGVCQRVFCNLQTMQCERENVELSEPCSPGDLCHEPGFCILGSCVSQQIKCPDSTACTLWSCRNSSGCSPKFLTGPCDPGVSCTVTGTCEKGNCIPDEMVDCDDSNGCTLDVCDPASGACIHTFTDMACDDDSICTVGDMCLNGLCAGTPMLCDDGEACTLDTCDSLTGVCTFEFTRGAVCDDNDACTVEDRCVSDTCVGIPLPCDDGNPCNGDELCTDGTCAALTKPSCGDGIVSLECNESCDDGNTSAGDGCSPDCQAEELNCSIDEDCTSDLPCIQSTCSESETCELKWLEGACDDNDPCTEEDHCQNGNCQGMLLDCNDGVSCTLDLCGEAGCFHQADDDLCETDGGPCFSALCNPEAGCQSSVVVGIPCSDGDSCTENDVCTLAEGCMGEPVICSESVCEEVFCLPEAGCSTTILSDTPCNDGDPCTVLDFCKEGACTGKPILDEIICGTEGAPFCSGVTEKDAQWECALSIASQSFSDVYAAGLQFTLSFNPEDITFEGLKDLICFDGAGCFDVDVSGPGGFPLSSGHQVSMAPMNAAGWDKQICDQTNPCVDGECIDGTCAGTGGFGGFIIVHLAVPETPLNEAYFDGEGELQGDSVIARAIFRNKTSPVVPPAVHIGDYIAVGTNGSDLQVTLIENILLTEPKQE